jgi:hypothetical protein
VREGEVPPEPKTIPAAWDGETAARWEFRGVFSWMEHNDLSVPFGSENAGRSFRRSGAKRDSLRAEHRFAIPAQCPQPDNMLPCCGLGALADAQFAFNSIQFLPDGVHGILQHIRLLL